MIVASSHLQTHDFNFPWGIPFTNQILRLCRLPTPKRRQAKIAETFQQDAINRGLFCGAFCWNLIAQGCFFFPFMSPGLVWNMSSAVLARTLPLEPLKWWHLLPGWGHGKRGLNVPWRRERPARHSVIWVLRCWSRSASLSLSLPNDLDRFCLSF